jgi:uncharacterized protein YjbI with pentapeptide repeats
MYAHARGDLMADHSQDSMIPRRRPLARPRIPTVLPPGSPDDVIEDDSVLRSLSYQNADFSEATAVSAEVECCRFNGVSFARSTLERVMISDSEMEQCDFAAMVARDCSLVRVVVRGSRMTGARLDQCAVRDGLFESCKMDMTAFRFTTFGSVLFSSCKMRQADFQNADLRGARFEECDLTEAQFSNATAEGAVFTDCMLYGLNGVASLKGAVVKSQDAIALLHSMAGVLGIRIAEG